MKMLQVRGEHLLTLFVMDGNELVASFIQQHGDSNVYNRSLPVQLAQGYAACNMKNSWDTPRARTSNWALIAGAKPTSLLYRGLCVA